MSDPIRKLTYEQLGYIIEKTGISEPKDAMLRFAEIMKMEDIPARKMAIVVAKLMERERKQLK